MNSDGGTLKSNVYIGALCGRTKCKDGTASLQQWNDDCSADTVNLLIFIHELRAVQRNYTHMLFLQAEPFPK